MNKLLFISFIILIGGFLSLQLSNSNRIVSFDIPDNWPKTVYDLNQITESSFELGRKLFYDPNISRDSTISCASCHLQYTGFTHVDHNVSHGIEGRKGTRNAPALINLAWNSSFHWDGGVNHIEVQAINPIQHPAEMDNSLVNVLEYLRTSREYRSLFFEAFQDSTPNSKHLLKAIAHFTGSLISANSKYDLFIKGEASLTEQEHRGLKLFRTYCSSCHTEPLFNINEYKSNGLPIDANYNDLGRYSITQLGSDSLKFRVPTLRNISHTFPYMHDGRFKKLKDVLEHYVNGIDHSDPFLSSELKKPITLTENNQKDIIAFLHTLTDKEFLYNPLFSFPR